MFEKDFGKFLPYDSKVEYLESTGTQWINTGAKKTTTTTVDCLFSLTNISPCAIFGSRSSSISLDRIALFCLGTNFRIDTNSQRFINITPDTTSLFHIQYNGVSSTCTLTNVTTGSSKSQINGIGQDGVFNIALFGVNTTGAVGNFLQGRIYLFKLYDNGVLVRDFQPVRFINEKDESEGAMYDKVSHQLFRNAGTGSFVIGPDLN